MLQPFEPFSAHILVRLTKLGRPYLVSQTYHRAPPSADERVQLLLTEYHEPGGAKLHLNAVKKDRYASIIDLQNDKHRKKLDEMLLADSKYRLFFAVVQSTGRLERQINRLCKEKIKRYIGHETNWRMNGIHEVKASVQLTFGELFIVLKHFSQTIRIRLEDIENIQLE